MIGRWGAACLLPVLTVALTACGSSAHRYAGIQREPTPVVDVATLPDVTNDGAPLTLRATPRGLLLVYFGYTRCPDVCPTTMADIRLALEDLPESARERIDVALVTVDPERDTVPVLSGYVRSFVADGHALRTLEPALLARVARAFGASYDVTRGADGSVEVGHTAFTYAVDDHGRLLLQWSFGTRWQDIRDDLAALLETQTPDSGHETAAGAPTHH